MPYQFCKAQLDNSSLIVYIVQVMRTVSIPLTGLKLSNDT